MRDFLNFDGPVMSTLTKIVTLVVVNALWVIFCIPIITAGASTTAFYYTIQKNIKYNRGYAAQCFWDSFRQNFKQSTKIWLIFLLIIVILMLDYGAIVTLAGAGKIPGGFEMIIYVLAVILGLYGIWVFAYVARFENTMGKTMKNAAILAVASLPYSFLILLLVAATYFIIWLLPPALLIMPGVCLWFASVLIEKVFRVNMSEEDRQLEDERNADWRGNENKKH